MTTTWNVFIDGKAAGFVTSTSFDVLENGSVTFRDDQGPVVILHRWDYFVRVIPAPQQPPQLVPVAQDAPAPVPAPEPAPVG